MRIVAGKYGSRHLKGPGHQRLRPTSDRLRETLFDILGPAGGGTLFIAAHAGAGVGGRGRSAMRRITATFLVLGAGEGGARRAGARRSARPGTAGGGRAHGRRP